ARLAESRQRRIDDVKVERRLDIGAAELGDVGGAEPRIQPPYARRAGRRLHTAEIDRARGVERIVPEIERGREQPRPDLVLQRRAKVIAVGERGGEIAGGSTGFVADGEFAKPVGRELDLPPGLKTRGLIVESGRTRRADLAGETAGQLGPFAGHFSQRRIGTSRKMTAQHAVDEAEPG